MRLVFAGPELLVHGTCYEGFPILLNMKMEPLEPANSFLLWACISRGSATSKSSWARYGQDLYDFFGFLENAPYLDWKRAPRIGEIGPVEAYRNWALSECGNSPRTVNHRLRTVKRFYNWCVKKSLLETPPFEYRDAIRPGQITFLAHVDTSAGEVRSPEFMLRELEGPISILSKEQCRVALEQLTNETHHLMLRLLLTTGLRSAELRSFPERCVFNPKKRKDVAGKAFVRVHLTSSEVNLKGGRPRSIDVPLSLMEDLYWWSVKSRPARFRRSPQGSLPSALFLTQNGTPFSEDAIGDVFRRLSRKLGFRIHPHLLRHTYATHTLYFLRSIRWRGDALIYVRNRLGHGSIETTRKWYLHLLDELDVDLIFKHDAEVDEVFGWPRTP